MSVWIVSLALAAGYLINKNFTVPGQLEIAEREYNSQRAAPSTDGATSSEVRKAWANTDFTRFGDMNTDLPKHEKRAIDQQVEIQHERVEQYDAPSVPAIEGVLMTFDRYDS